MNTRLLKLQEKRRSAGKIHRKPSADPAQTRHELRVRLGVLDELAAEVYALTVFLCDDLQLKPASHLAATPNHAAPAATTQLFAIVKRLPMELQMMLCHRAVDSTKQNILRKDSESASNHLPGFFFFDSWFFVSFICFFFFFFLSFVSFSFLLSFSSSFCSCPWSVLTFSTNI